MGIEKDLFKEYREHLEIRPGGILVKKAKDEPEQFAPSEDIANYPYIVLNRGKIHWVHIDVDRLPSQFEDIGMRAQAIRWAAFDPERFDALNIPYPTFSVLSGTSVHFLWPLSCPMSPRPSKKSLLYYLDVRRNLTLAVGGDTACPAIGVAAKNPFFGKHLAQRYPTRPCALADLRVEGVTSGRSAILAPVVYEKGQRNYATFRAALKHFRLRPGVTAEELMAFIEVFQAEWAASPLSTGENRGIVASIIRNADRYRIRADRDYGAMRLPSLKGTGLPPEQMLAAIRERQAVGAKFSAARRSAKKKEAVALAVASLMAGGQKITGEAIARRAGVTVRFVWKCISLRQGLVTWK